MDNSIATCPPFEHKRLNDEIFIKSFTGILNKRGYNLEDANTSDSNSVSILSTTSLNSNISSIIASLREPIHGQTSLHLACRKGDLQVVDALIRNDCIAQLVHLMDNNGNTALHFAVSALRYRQSEEIVQKLLDADASIHAQNNKSLTPIAVHILTLKSDNAVILVKLLEKGAAVETEIEGDSILHLAVRRQLKCVASTLVKYGASYISLNRFGLMAFKMASVPVRQAMISSIVSIQPFLPMSQRAKCMRCNREVMTHIRRASLAITRLLRLPMRDHKHNCYRCGLIYCGKCLRIRRLTLGIPIFLQRAEMDAQLSKLPICSFCDSILWEHRNWTK
uniref:Myosinlike protein putative n=1 Tax=Albugo laibachii Nc14 TaxID=890382 RepID=F0WVG6_9STRA|nr:myosinlike protein putative [Albugo laibachii Nc14]|eukprot:CCA25407.1 myosinlike protein putative [Albugo laibachii Nc14]